MKWEKCMKKFNCKVCDDYLFCKDDINEKIKVLKTKKKKGKRKNNG